VPASFPLRQIGKVLRKVQSRCQLAEQHRWFVQQGRTPAERQTRAALARALRRISTHLKCAHSPMELLLIADFLLASPLPGPVVECGCYKGGSTAKLSLAARATGRRLLVCDSFAGLPVPAHEDRSLVTLHHEPYAQGMFAGTLAEVQDNVAAFGAPEVCEYHQGYFKETLPGLPVEGLSCAFIDVDLISSATDCLLSLWPRLVHGGRIYLHEARDLAFIRGITNPQWWQANLGQAPPLLLGAGYGCGEGAPQLAYFEKTAGR
jgi:O-methyltransferase